MSYFSHLFSNVKLLFNSFSYNYDPPNSRFDPQSTLNSAIIECSNQGKLLLLRLTESNQDMENSLNLPPESFLIYQIPYNSRHSFQITSDLPISSFPFTGLFFCPTSNPKNMRLLFTVNTTNDFLKVPSFYDELAADLIERRERYHATQVAREILTNQDQEYQEVLNEAKKIEEERHKKEERERVIENHKEIKKSAALKRYNLLPSQIDHNDPSAITIRCMIANKTQKERIFSKNEPARNLYDFVNIDFAPEDPKIMFGFPSRTLTTNDLDKTFAELGFSKKETVFVDSNDSDEEEESD